MTEYRQARFTLPSGATDLLLVRHGESEPARAGTPFPLIDGQSDPALAEAGHEQAELVGARLAGQHPDAVYVTPLRRTSMTALPLLTRTGLSSQAEPELREVHLGDWEGGVFRRKVAEDDPVLHRMYAEQRWDVIPGAESPETFAERVRAAISRIAAKHPDQRVVAFTHGGVIAEVMRQTADARPLAFLGADNGSVSQVVVDGSSWILRRFNDTAHLHSASDPSAAPLS
ncbi:histidine phosphatase family protein [Salinifilum aidingensis]